MLVGALLLALLAACGADAGADAAGGRHDTPPVLCTLDAQCPGDQVCQSGACSVAVAERVFDITFLPSNGSIFPAQRIQNIQTKPAERLDFVLESSVNVTGRLVANGKDTFASEQATLIFERMDAGGGAIVRPQVNVQDGTFTVDLLPGAYDITCIFANPQLPKRLWRGRQIGESSTELLLPLPLPGLIREARYTVTRREPGIMPTASAIVPVVGARVLATTASGQTSTVGVTDESGNVTLRVWSDVEEAYEVRIGPNAPDALMPSVSYPGLLRPGGDGGEPVGIGMGQWSQREVTLELDFLSRLTELDIELSEARIVFEAPVEQGRFVLSRSLERRGQPLNVMPLKYEVTIYPQSTSIYGPLRFSWDATSPEALYAFAQALDRGKFPKKQQVLFKLLQSQGLPLQGAQLLLTPKTQGSSAQVDLAPQVIDSSVDQTLSAWLEPGVVYEVQVQPADSGQPQGLFLVQAPVPASQTSKVQTLQLAAPLVIFGSVLDAELRGQGNLILELQDRFAQASRTIATARTGAEGRFRAVVPATPYDDKVPAMPQEPGPMELPEQPK